MNGGEGNANAANKQVSSVPAQNMQPTSAVSANFDASKLGGDQKQKKVKNQKPKIKNDNFAPRANNPKRPIWFWIVLGLLGLVIIGVAIWAVITLTNNGQSDTTGGLQLKDGITGDGDTDNDSSFVADYVAQLQELYDDNAADGNGNTGSQKVSTIVEQALNTDRGSSQADTIRLAELTVAYDNFEYERAAEIINQINPDGLSLLDRIHYYAVARSVYNENGNSVDAQAASAMVTELTKQFCNMGKCTQ